MATDRHNKQYVALDCEMIGVGERFSALAEVAIVDWNGKTIYHSYVRPPPDQVVSDYRTAVSGITKEILDRHGKPFTVVQKEVLNLLRGKILVGHALENDLKALRIDVPMDQRRNTSHLPNFKTLHKKGALLPQSLKSLAQQYLGVEIQSGQHDPAEDARIAMRIFRENKDLWNAPTTPIGPTLPRMPLPSSTPTPAPTPVSNSSRKSRGGKSRRRKSSRSRRQ